MAAKNAKYSKFGMGLFTTKCAMSLRSSAEDENGGISLHRVLPSNRHSRPVELQPVLHGGNPGLLCAELAWIPAFAGMTETSFRRVRFAHRSVSEYLAQSMS